MDDYDISGKLGDLFPNKDREWPMYSYDRPSSILWNAIARKLHAAGWSDDKIKEWLQSKYSRWALDGLLGDAIETIGETYADKILEPPTKLRTAQDPRDVIKRSLAEVPALQPGPLTVKLPPQGPKVGDSFTIKNMSEKILEVRPTAGGVFEVYEKSDKP